MTSKFSSHALECLASVHPDLVKVAEKARDIVAFTVTEGLRSKKKQATNVASGKSQTLNSRHLTGHAIDIAALDNSGMIQWDWHHYPLIADAMKAAAHDLGIPITWGGDWHSLKDGCHFELSWNAYPLTDAKTEENQQ